jgi:hypothetical protein
LAVVLEIKAGSLAGRKMAVRPGDALLVGRAPDRAQFTVPHDNHMSGVHFAVECGPNVCRVIDPKDTRYLFCLNSESAAMRCAKLARQPCGTSPFSRPANETRSGLAA